MRSNFPLRTNRCRAFLASLVVFILSGGVDAFASTEIWQSVTQQVMRNDFVGVVQCTRAGLGMARFAVLECWKGDPALEECVIRFHHDEFGDCFDPPARVGERFVVAAKCAKRLVRQSLRIRPRSTDPWRLWGWTPDLVVQHSDALERVIDGELPSGTFGFRAWDSTLANVRREVSAILALSPEALEIRLLRDSIEFVGPLRRIGRTLPRPPPAQTVVEFLTKLMASPEIVAPRKKGGAEILLGILRREGRDHTLHYVKSGGALPVRADSDDRERKRLIAAIEARLAKELEARPW